MPRMTPQALAQKWQQKTAASTEAYKAGIQAVQGNPAQKAIAAKDLWIARVNEAAQNGRYEAGLSKVTEAGWKAAAMEKGAANIAAGARQGALRVEQAERIIGPQRDAIVANLPARGTLDQNLERAAQMADHSRSEARQAIWDLRAPEPEEGTPFFRELEESLLQSWPEGSMPKLELLHEGNLSSVLPRRVVSHLLRIAQESVANAFKHAGATRIVVTWSESAQELQLSITDDGKGIHPGDLENAIARGHFGLLGLRERAHKLMGVLRIVSPVPACPSGSTVILTLPRSSLTNP